MFSLPPILKPLLRKKLTVFLLSLQIALITMLLSNLTHVLNEINNFYTEPTGIDDKQLLILNLRVPPEIKGIFLSDGLRDQEIIKKIAGVEDVAAINATPFAWDNQLQFRSFSTHADNSPEKIAYVRSTVSPTTISSLGLKLLAGRQFENSDMAFTYKDQAKTIIVTQALAKALFGESNNAIGKVVYDADKQYEIIGVVSDWKGFATKIYRRESTAFFPEYNEYNKDFRYLIRTSSAEVRDQVMQNVEGYIARQYPQGVIYYGEKLDEIIGRFMNRSLITLFIIITLVLTIASIIAIAGQSYFSVHQRRKQLGVLRALGATKTKLILQILLENAAIGLLGILVGTALAALLSQAMYESSDIVALSPRFLCGTAISVFAVCLLSAAIPAWQAGKISPSLATRTL